MAARRAAISTRPVPASGLTGSRTGCAERRRRRPRCSRGQPFGKERPQYAFPSIALAGFKGCIEAKAGNKRHSQFTLVEMVALIGAYGLTKHIFLACDFASLRMAGEHVIAVGLVKSIVDDFAREV